MIKKCAVALTDWLISSEVIKKEDKEIYIYASHCFFLSLLPFLMAVMIGTILGRVLHSIILIIPFMLIRKYSGGYHAQNSRMCLVYSWAILFLFIYISKCISWNAGIFLITVCAIAILWIFSPIDSENRRLEDSEKKTYKKQTIILSLFFIAVAVVFLLLELSSYACSLSLGIIMTASLQIPCIAREHSFELL